MKDYTDVIIAPVITEKSMYAKNNGVYTFKVNKSANKIQIKNAIEKYRKDKKSKKLAVILLENPPYAQTNSNKDGGIRSNY